MRFHATVAFTPTKDADEAAHAAAFEACTHRLVAVLGQLPDAVNPTVTGGLSGYQLVVSATVTSADQAEDAALFSALLRTALHAAGVGTPHWPGLAA
ncbi:hypothetical protein [Nocardiopsis alborubida]|uniref:Uncharacterized protein n=1 Tax=Nocardiopsis alborubida TaxID=146802 RepID=A0A7X6RP13_9ACTN|nr:hypothetical protein [Nocardiopsis alborubida]NKY96697.1 hypothetical protein [Nocardiopsis alborubida]